MRISLQKVLATLDALAITYKTALKTDVEQVFEVASLFKPVDFGFYFINGCLELPRDLQNSLLLLKEEHKTNAAHSVSNNSCVYLVDDPQKVYYRILNTLFSRASNAHISTLSSIHPEAVIGKNVEIGAFSVIGRCVIGDNVIIGSQTKVYDNAVIGKNTIVESLSSIGTQGVAWVWDKNQENKIVQPQLGGVEIGEDCFLGSNTIIVRGSLNDNTKVGDNTLFAPGCRIGHGSQIGNSVHFANNICTGGNIKIGDDAFVGSGATFRPRVRVHPRTIVGAGALVIKNTTTAGKTLVGIPAKEMETKKKPFGMPRPKILKKNYDIK